MTQLLNFPSTVSASTVISTGSLQTAGLVLTPVTPVTVANAATVNLSATVSLNVLRPTADGTIAGAVINVPGSPVDGQICDIITTAEITTVTGTISGANVIPAVATLTAGTLTRLVYNTTATKWFSGK